MYPVMKSLFAGISILSTWLSLSVLAAPPEVSVDGTQVLGKISSTCDNINVAAPAKVTVDGTQVLGTVSQTYRKVEAYLGLPYATQQRFKPSVLQSMASLDISRFHASEFGPSCFQAALSLAVPPTANFSEDCLSLNIYRPARIRRRSAPLPVMVFIHGGGFTAGSSVSYDGFSMVERSISRRTPMIFVTMNYRLGQLGFPQGDEAAANDALNLGLKDQLVALEWIKQHIRYFGGDPTKVTLSGESAGATSVFYHLLGSSLSNLARAGIVESYAAFQHRNASLGNDIWSQWVSSVPSCSNSTSGNDAFECIQGLTNSSEIQESMPTAAGNLFLPVVHADDSILPDYPSQLTLESGMPVLLGTNLDEGTFFTPFDISSFSDIRTNLIAYGSPPLRSQEALETIADEIIAQYSIEPSEGSPYGTGNETFGLHPAFKQFAAIAGDVIFHGPTRDLANSLADSDYPTYMYHFTDQGFGANVPPIPEGVLGVTHATDVYALRLGNATEAGVSFADATSPASVHLSDQMQDYWISFVTRLNPNDKRGTTRPEWKAYDVEQPEMMRLDGTDIGMVSGLLRDEAISIINADPMIFRR